MTSISQNYMNWLTEPKIINKKGLNTLVTLLIKKIVQISMKPTIKALNIYPISLFPKIYRQIFFNIF